MHKGMQLLSAATLILLGMVTAQAQINTSTQPIQEHERAALFPSAHMLETGRNVAETACVKCHGIDGMGISGEQPQLAGQRSVYLYRVLQAYQKSDRQNNTMQHISSLLNEDALLAVSAYYASLTPARKNDASATITEPVTLGEDPFSGLRGSIKKCSKCHGETGNSTASGVPSLTTQAPEYFSIAMRAYAEGTRGHKLMSRFAGKLDEQTINELGVYYAVQKPLKTDVSGEGDAVAGQQAAQDCANCHGEDGNAGSAKTPSLAGQDPRYFVKAIAAYQEGKRQQDAMNKAVDGLSATKVNDLATFYARQEPRQRKVRTPLTATQLIKRCARCHGQDGNSTDPRFPALAGQNEAYLNKTMQDYSHSLRTEETMHAMSQLLTDSDIEQLARHYSMQEPKYHFVYPITLPAS